MYSMFQKPNIVKNGFGCHSHRIWIWILGSKIEKPILYLTPVVKLQIVFQKVFKFF
jgi:hypothetical protein